MGEENQSFVAEFIFLGLSQDWQTQILLFVLFLSIYLLTVLGNLLIIILIFVDSQLHTPMYFFLRNLSFADLCFSTSIVPQLLVHFMVKKKTISFLGCMTQIIVFLLVGCTECALLAVMSYDRYVAVCKPLHYSTIMTQQMCLQLTIGSWVSGALVSLVDTTFTFQLPYGGQNIINHYFCEPPALLKLASADTYSTEMAIFAMGVLILLAPVSLILVSYWNIISTVIQMQSGEGRLKAFSTCGSHLIVVVLFYGSGIFTYMRPNSKTTKEQDKMISVFYTVVTPMLNPIIYSLKNKDVKRALRKLAGRKSFSQRQWSLGLIFRAMVTHLKEEQNFNRPLWIKSYQEEGGKLRICSRNWIFYSMLEHRGEIKDKKFVYILIMKSVKCYFEGVWLI